MSTCCSSCRTRGHKLAGSAARAPERAYLPGAKNHVQFEPFRIGSFAPCAGAQDERTAEEVPVDPHDAYPDDMTLAEGLFRYQEYVTPEVTRPIATWAGLRTFAPDRQLVLGRAVDAPSFVWCAGQGGYGFQTAPAASALIADILAERVPEIGADLAQALSPARFG